MNLDKPKKSNKAIIIMCILLGIVAVITIALTYRIVVYFIDMNNEENNTFSYPPAPGGCWCAQQRSCKTRRAARWQAP